MGCSSGGQTQISTAKNFNSYFRPKKQVIIEKLEIFSLNTIVFILF